MTGKLRHNRAVVIGLLALGGCTIADLRPGVVRHVTPKQIRQQFRGPDVSIRAEVVRDFRAHVIKPVVSIRDSAYILVGDIGDDGTLRILYPARPDIPNLLKRGGSFEAPYFQPRVILPWVNVAFRPTRTASGHTFVIASRTPLNLSKLAEDSVSWSLFDVYYDNFRDPKSAVTDLAAAISSDVTDVSISTSPYGSALIGRGVPPAQTRGSSSLVPDPKAPGGARRRPPG